MKIYRPELRGKCKEYALKEVEKDPALTLVKGWYYSPITDTKEQHWWTVEPNGEIYDPTAEQFLDLGTGDYIPFVGTYTCDVCSEPFDEGAGYPTGNHYLICSYECYGDLIGYNSETGTFDYG
jgi:hypothetical protein